MIFNRNTFSLTKRQKSSKKVTDIFKKCLFFIQLIEYKRMFKTQIDKQAISGVFIEPVINYDI